MIDAYILRGHEPVPEPDIVKWGRWFETADRTVALTRRELFSVSTVFLGLDHRFFGEGPPLLFESMAFADQTHEDIECERYASWDDAEAGRQAMVSRMLELIERARVPALVTSDPSASSGRSPSRGGRRPPRPDRGGA